MSAKEIVWSPEQVLVHQAFGDNSMGHVVVDAKAGTGKTTTVVGGFSHAAGARLGYIVFNKKNVIEARGKIKDPRVDIRSANSLGFFYVKRIWKNAAPDTDGDGIEYDRIKAVDGFLKKEETALVYKLVGLAKNTFVDVPSFADMLDLAKRKVEFDEEFEERGVKVAIGVLERSKTVRDPEGRISFNDQCFLAVANKWVTKRYDLLVVDEFQDQNAPQIEMAKRAANRLIVVGDSNQAIYEFRGAVQNAMTKAHRELNATLLSLTVTRRNPKLVVELVHDVVPNFTAAPEAPLGIVEACTEANAVERAKPGDAILSRLNAPLMPLALKFIRNNVPARIEGRDVGAQLLRLVRSFDAPSVKLLVKSIEEWRAKQVERLEHARNAEKRIEQANDMASTLVALAQDCEEVRGCERRIQSLFADTDGNSPPAVVLSSVHKAKGLEWDRVFVLSATLRKGSGQEEDNIWYVAMTRTKRELYLVDGVVPDRVKNYVARASLTDRQRDEANVNPAVLAFHRGETKPSGPPPRSTPPPRSGPPPRLEAQPESSKSKPPPRRGYSPEALRVLEKKRANVPDQLKLRQGAEYFKRGDVIVRSDGEWVCVRVNQCNARFRKIASSVKRINYTDADGESASKEITRKGEEWDFCNSYDVGDPEVRPGAMSETEIEAFEPRSARRSQSDSKGEQTNKNQNESDNNMSKNKVDMSGKGLVKAFQSGASKADTYKKFCEALVWWKGEKGKALFNQRWAKAEEKQKAEAKAAADKGKTAAKAAPAPAKGGKKGGKGGGKKGGTSGGKKPAPATDNASQAAQDAGKPAGGPPPRSTPPPAAAPAPDATGTAVP